MSLETSGWAAALLSGLGAGLIATLATLAIERLGGKLGGVIGTLPTTIIPASWGVWLQVTGGLSGGQSALGGAPLHSASPLFANAMYAVPVGMSLNALFLWLWRALPARLPSAWVGDEVSDEVSDEPNRAPSRLFTVGVLSGLTLGAWLFGALIWVSVSRHLTPEALRRAGVIATALIVLMGMWATYRGRPAPRGARSVPLRALFTRGLCAFIAVMIAVLISHSGAATLAGVAAVFPAIFWTTMVSLWFSQGSAVPTGAVGPMMLGSSSVSVFALLTPWLYPMLGAGWGALIAWLIAALGASVPSYLWVSSRARERTMV